MLHNSALFHVVDSCCHATLDNLVVGVESMDMHLCSGSVLLVPGRPCVPDSQGCENLLLSAPAPSPKDNL